MNIKKIGNAPVSQSEFTAITKALKENSLVKKSTYIPNLEIKANGKTYIGTYQGAPYNSFTITKEVGAETPESTNAETKTPENFTLEPPSATELMKLKKADLIKIAESKSLALDSNETKKDLVAKILASK